MTEVVALDGGTRRSRRVFRPAALALAAALAACGDDGEAGRALGYVEGDYLLIAAEGSGRIVSLLVEPGDRVEAGAILAELDQTAAAARRDRSVAELAVAEAELEDLRLGKRREEILVIEAKIAEARATLAVARREFERLDRLKEERVVSDSALDQRQQAFQAAAARLRELEGELEVAALPARPHAIAAAEQRVVAKRAAADEAEWQLRTRLLLSPAAGVIEDVFYRPGEVVDTGRPVVSLLPPDSLMVRLFVPEADLAALRLGQQVAIGCDGCAPDLAGEIGFIATEPEFTPPVLYSPESRGGLVFKVNVRPKNGAPLRVGQPVDVVLPGRPAGS